MKKYFLVVCAVFMFVFISAPNTQADMKEKGVICSNSLKGFGASKDVIKKVCESLVASKRDAQLSEVLNFMRTRTKFTAICGTVRDILVSLNALNDKNMWGVGCAPAHLSDGQIGRHGRSYGN